MKVYRVGGLRHETVVFAESEEEARARALEGGEVQEWEQYWAGELLVKEVSLPEGWELKRKEPGENPLPGRQELLMEIEQLLCQELPVTPGALERVREAIGQAGELGLGEEAVGVLLDFIVMQDVNLEIRQYRSERAAEDRSIRDADDLAKG